MKPNDGSSRGVDPRLLDRLVDGEMSEAERGDLLGSLDEQPDGWKQCALAFLEAQAWEEELRSMARGPAVQAASRRAGRRRAAATAAASGRAGRWIRRGGTLLAMAGSFLAALLLSSIIGGLWRGKEPSGGLPGELIAGNGPSEALAERDLAGTPGLEPLERSQSYAGPTRMVKLSLPRGPDGRRETVELPAYERDSLDEDWARSLPPAIPPEVVRAFERAGHQVWQRRELLRLWTPDGRQLIVPVDEVDVHYVGGPPQ